MKCRDHCPQKAHAPPPFFQKKLFHLIYFQLHIRYLNSSLSSFSLPVFFSFSLSLFLSFSLYLSFSLSVFLALSLLLFFSICLLQLSFLLSFSLSFLLSFSLSLFLSFSLSLFLSFSLSLFLLSLFLFIIMFTAELVQLPWMLIITYNRKSIHRWLINLNC